MEYRAVGSRCAFDSGCLPDEARVQAGEILEYLGFKPVDVDVLALARSCVGRSRFVKRVNPDYAPEQVNCSSLTKWLFGQCGIWLPRLAIQQRMLGFPVPREQIAAGDLIFATARLNLYLDDSADGVGHVGIVTERQTVIHAKGKKSGVVEEAAEKFLLPSRFRGIRRIIDPCHSVRTFEVPASAFVETSDDIWWLLIQEFYRRKGGKDA